MHALVKEGVRELTKPTISGITLCSLQALSDKSRAVLVYQAYTLIKTCNCASQVAWRCFTCTTVAVLVVTQLNPE